MKHILLLAALALAFLGTAPIPAFADTTSSVVVGTCGLKTYTIGTIQATTMDTTGNQCAGSGGSGSTNATIVGPLGTGCTSTGCVAVGLSAADEAALQSIITNTGGSVPAGPNLIGGVRIDQTTPGSTNNVTVSTNVGTLPLLQATASAAVSTSSAATLQVVAASGSTVIRVMQWELVTTLANNVTWESGDTGGSCANPVALSGAMPFAANGGASAGSGLGPVLVLPSGKALCMLTSAATQISGSVAYAQF